MDTLSWVLLFLGAICAGGGLLYERGAIGRPARWRHHYQRSTRLIAEPEREAAAAYLRQRASEKESTAKSSEGRASPGLIEEIRRGARWLRGAAEIVAGTPLESLQSNEFTTVDMREIERRTLTAEKAMAEARDLNVKLERECAGLTADLTETTRCLEELQRTTGTKHPLGALLTNVPPGAVRGNPVAEAIGQRFDPIAEEVRKAIQGGAVAAHIVAPGVALNFKPTAKHIFAPGSVLPDPSQPLPGERKWNGLGLDEAELRDLRIPQDFPAQVAALKALGPPMRGISTEDFIAYAKSQGVTITDEQIEAMRAQSAGVQVTPARPLTRPLIDAAVQRQERAQARAAAEEYIAAFESHAPLKVPGERDSHMQFWELVRAKWPRDEQGRPLVLQRSDDPKVDGFERYPALQRMLPFSIRTELLELVREQTVNRAVSMGMVPNAMEGLRFDPPDRWVWQDIGRPAERVRPEPITMAGDGYPSLQIHGSRGPVVDEPAGPPPERTYFDSRTLAPDLSTLVGTWQEPDADELAEIAQALWETWQDPGSNEPVPMADLLAVEEIRALLGPDPGNMLNRLVAARVVAGDDDGAGYRLINRGSRGKGPQWCWERVS